MAEKVTVRHICDLHEGEVDAVAAVPFALEGSSYELDACEEHLAQMRDAFAPYVGAARRADRASTAGAPRTNPSRGTSRASSSGAGDREQVQAKREWARANGFAVSDRGRLSAEVLQAYDAAH